MTDQMHEWNDQLWNDLLAQLDGAEANHGGASAAVQKVAAIYQTPMPGAARERARQRVFESMPDTKENTMTAASIPIDRPVANGQRMPIKPVSRTHSTQSRPKWVWAALAAVLVLVLGGAGSYLGHGGERPIFGGASSTRQPESIPAATAESGWPQFRGGAARTGYTSDPGPGGTLDLRWTFSVDEVASNVVSDGGTVYVSGRKGGLWALDANTGMQRWGVDLSQGEYNDENRWPIPTIANGAVYQGTYDGNVIALDAADGSVIWQQAISTAPIIASVTFVDDVLYVVTPEGAILSLDAATGDTNWEWTGTAGLSTWALAAGGGLLYVPDVAGNVVAIDMTTGETAWTAELGEAYRNPAYSDGAVYIGSDSGSYYALDATDGSVIWTSDPITDGQTLNPVVTPTEVIVSYENGPLQALDRSTGQVIWKAEGPGSSRSAHASAAAAYSISRDLSALVAYDLTTGTELGRVSADGLSSNAAISGDRIVFGSNADVGVVRAFGPGGGAVVESTAGPATAIAPTTLDASAATVVASPGAFDASQIGIAWQTDPSTVADPGPLAIAPDGKIYVTDLQTDTIQIFGPDGTPLGSMGESGSGPGQLAFRQGDGVFANIDIDDEGNIYVFDTYNDRVQKFAPDGSFLLEWGQSGSGSGEIQEATGGIDPTTGTVYVTDINNRVQVFDSEGNFLDKWGSSGAGPAKFQNPLDVVVDSQGNIYVSQEENGPVQVFDAYGQYLRSIVPPDGGFSLVLAMAIDANDNLFVANYGANAIQIFDPSGTMIGEITALPDGTALSGPAGLAIDASGNLFIADEGNLRVLKLELPALK